MNEQKSLIDCQFDAFLDLDRDQQSNAVSTLLGAVDYAFRKSGVIGEKQFVEFFRYVIEQQKTHN
jgi:hypothetical protein